MGSVVGKTLGLGFLLGEGFNKARRDEIEVGTDVTPDEMMMAWRGKKRERGDTSLVFG